MELQVNSVSSQLVSHNSKNKVLVAEISDLGLANFDRLYDDAADVGFELVHPENGNRTRWALEKEIRAPLEGELMGWVFKPTPESIRKQPVLAGYSFRLIND